MTARDFEEKRSFVRMQVETEVSFSIEGEQGQNYRGTSQDLSATGLLLRSEHAPRLDDELSIIIDTGSERLPPFVCSGRVKRVSADADHPGHYLISVALSRTQ